jgi:hypothetical protein
MLCHTESVEDDIVEGFAVRKRVGFFLTDGLGEFGAKIICFHFIFARKSPALITFTMFLMLSVKKCASPVKK